MPSNTLVSYPEGGNYVEVTFRIFPDTAKPDRFHIATNSPKFVDENGQRPGLHLVVSSNPGSADYNPASYNRLVRFWDRQSDRPHLHLHGHGIAELGDRRLKARVARIVTAGLKQLSGS